MNVGIFADIINNPRLFTAHCVIQSLELGGLIVLTLRGIENGRL